MATPSRKVKEIQLDTGKGQQSLTHIKDLKADVNLPPKILNMVDSKVHWEQIYTDKSPLEVSWHQFKPEISLQLIQHAQLAVDDWIIDVGGGSSTLVDHLIDAGYSKIAVLDISDKALSYVRDRLGEKAEHIEWYSEDITGFTPSHPFSIWHDRAVFHFLTAEKDRKKYISVLNQSLKSGGYLIIAAFAIGGPTQCSGLDIVQYDGNKLAAELGPGFNLLEEIDEIHLTPAKKVQKFSYFRFVKQS